MTDLRKGPKSPSHGDHRLAGVDHDHVSGVAHAGDDGDIHVAIGFGRRPARQDPDGGAALGLGAPADSLHDSAQSAANDHYVPSGQFTPNLFRQFHVLPSCWIAAADH